MSKRVCKDDQIQLIMECRQSGLSDYQWCKQNGIHPGNFYNWVSKLRKQGYSFPDSQSKIQLPPYIIKSFFLIFKEFLFSMPIFFSLSVFSFPTKLSLFFD